MLIELSDAEIMDIKKALAYQIAKLDTRVYNANMGADELAKGHIAEFEAEILRLNTLLQKIRSQSEQN